MHVRLVNIGYGNVVVAERIVAVISPESAPMKRFKDEARKAGRLIDGTQGRRTRSILVTDSHHVVLSALQTETVGERLERNTSGPAQSHPVSIHPVPIEDRMEAAERAEAAEPPESDLPDPIDPQDPPESPESIDPQEPIEPPYAADEEEPEGDGGEDLRSSEEGGGEEGGEDETAGTTDKGRA